MNDVALEEPYIYDGQPTVATGADSDWIVPPGQLFVMGDHREDFGGLARLRARRARPRHRARMAAVLAHRHVRRPAHPLVPGAHRVARRRRVEPGPRDPGGEPLDAVIAALGLAAAVVVVASAVIAVSARDARIGIVGFALASVVSSVVADPLPAAIPLLFRVVAALFAAYLLWITVRETDTRVGATSLGWPVEALAAPPPS